jgi:hypothetical protein
MTTKPDLKNLIKAGAIVQEAIKSLEAELLKAYKGRTVFLPKNTVPYQGEAEGPCLVESIALFGNDDNSQKFSWLQLYVSFFSEGDGCDNIDIVSVELQYLDRLKFLV